MSDRNTITSKDGKYKGVLQETDGNFVVYRTADSKRIASLGATDPDPIKPVPEPEPRAPPETNQRSFIVSTPILRSREIIIAVILLIGILYWVFS